MDSHYSNLGMAITKLMGTSLVVSADNAIMVGAATQGLPAKQKQTAIVWGNLAAAGLRVGLALGAGALGILHNPFFLVAGGAFLAHAAVGMVKAHDAHTNEGASSIAQALKTVIVSDAVMSADNVMAVLSQANTLAAGTGMSAATLASTAMIAATPIALLAGTGIANSMERFPLIKALGGMFIAHLGSHMITSGLGALLPAAFAAPAVAMSLSIGLAMAVSTGVIYTMGKTFAQQQGIEQPTVRQCMQALGKEIVREIKDVPQASKDLFLFIRHLPQTTLEFLKHMPRALNERGQEIKAATQWVFSQSWGQMIKDKVSSIYHAGQNTVKQSLDKLPTLLGIEQKIKQTHYTDPEHQQPINPGPSSVNTTVKVK